MIFFFSQKPLAALSEMCQPRHLVCRHGPEEPIRLTSFATSANASAITGACAA